MTNAVYDRLLAEMQAGLDRAMLRVVSFHTGRKRALGRYLIVEALRLEGFDVSERQARQCIHDLRRAGHLICSAPGEEGGYYLAASLDEFREFCERELHPKALDMLETESAMKAAARQQFGEASQPQMI
jgi:predicted DNA-binding transcriptional regulator YafY